MDFLVPGSFDKARRKLNQDCEYQYAGEVLRGEAIVDAFEQNHARASAELDAIAYLPGVVDSVTDQTAVIRVFDRLELQGRTHLYSDRLAVTVVWSGADWTVIRIEHLPFVEERRKLEVFRRGDAL